MTVRLATGPNTGLTPATIPAGHAAVVQVGDQFVALGRPPEPSGAVIAVYCEQTPFNAANVRIVSTAGDDVFHDNLGGAALAIGRSWGAIVAGLTPTGWTGSVMLKFQMPDNSWIDVTPTKSKVWTSPTPPTAVVDKSGVVPGDPPWQATGTSLAVAVSMTSTDTQPGMPGWDRAPDMDATTPIGWLFGFWLRDVTPGPYPFTGTANLSYARPAGMTYAALRPA